MTLKLHQLIAGEKTVRNSASQQFTKAYQMIQKQPLFAGISRVYTPRDDEGQQLPPESQRVQQRVQDMAAVVADAMQSLLDVTARKDWTNQVAIADVVVDGITLITGAPATYLLWLEKQLQDLHTFVNALPTLDPNDEWSWDEDRGVWASQELKSTRTAKVPRNHVKAVATEKFPAQVEVYHEDVVVGTWTTVKLSGGIRLGTKRVLLGRIERTQVAVKAAREQANSAEVEDVAPGATVMGFLFAELLV